MHHHLKTSYSRDDWYDAAPLTPYWRDQVNNAKDKVKDAAGLILPCKVVAELTFGFWVDLTGRHYNNPLWVGRRLSAAFPNTTSPRHDVLTRLKEIQRLRNRISHHERILTSRGKLYTGGGFLTLPEVLAPTDWVCADTASWLKVRFRYVAAQRVLTAVPSFGVRL
jgi:hypothetical protein